MFGALLRHVRTIKDTSSVVLYCLRTLQLSLELASWSWVLTGGLPYSSTNNLALYKLISIIRVSAL